MSEQIDSDPKQPEQNPASPSAVLNAPFDQLDQALKTLAQAQMRFAPGATWSATGLLHERYLKRQRLSPTPYRRALSINQWRMTAASAKNCACSAWATRLPNAERRRAIERQVLRQLQVLRAALAECLELNYG